MDEFKIFDLGDFQFQSGDVLPRAKLAYQTDGRLNTEESNTVILGVPVAGTYEDARAIHLEGSDLPISPEHHFIIIPNMFGNDLSSSPSNTKEPFNGPDFPRVPIYDNVVAQHKLVTEELGITQLKLAAGFSMGGHQAYHWASL